MHTVARLKSFDKAAKQSNVSEAEIEDIISYLAENPLAGDEMAGTGGCRKVRFAGQGKGKSGGFRTVTFYSGDDMPVFLVTIFAKGERSTLSGREASALKTITKNIVAEYKKRVASLSERKGLVG